MRYFTLPYIITLCYVSLRCVALRLPYFTLHSITLHTHAFTYELPSKSFTCDIVIVISFGGALSLSRIMWKSINSRSNMKPKSNPKQARKRIEELLCWFQVLRQHFMFLSCCIHLHACSFHFPFMFLLVVFISLYFPFIFLSYSFQCAFMSFHLPFNLHACSFFAFTSFHFLKLWKWL